MSAENPEVSILVPAYNAKRYLGALIGSVLDQSFQDWELIIVDDGSSDGTFKIADKYAQSDSRIKVISSANKGVSSARNLCLDSAKGKYIFFADCDDVLEPDCLKKLLDHKADNADIIQCSFAFIDDSENKTPDPNPISKTYCDSQSIMDAFLNGPTGDIRVSVWAKLFRREVFSDVRFDTDLRVCEDALYVYECCRKAKEAVCISTPLYLYRQRTGSVMSSGLAQNYKDYFKFFDRLKQDFCNDKTPYKKTVKREAETALWLMRLFADKDNLKELWYLRKEALSVAGTVICSSAPFSLKIKLTGLAIMPHIYFSMLRKRTVSDNAQI